MNFGLTGPIAERGLLVENDLIEIEVAEHRHRVKGIRDLADRDEPRIVAVLHRAVASDLNLISGEGLQFLAES